MTRTARAWLWALSLLATACSTTPAADTSAPRELAESVVIKGEQPLPASGMTPAVATNGQLYLAVWADNRNGSWDIFGARVTPNGQFLGSEFGIATAAGDQLLPRVAFDGTNFLVVWEDHAKGTDVDVFGARVAPDGTVLDPSGFAISAGSSNEVAPDVTGAPGSAFVTWVDDRATPGPGAYGARVTGGAVVDAAGIPVVVQAGDASGGCVAASNGSSFLAVSTQYSGSLLAVVVGLDGSVGSPAMLTASGSNGVSSLAATSDGTRYLATWSDFVNVFGAFVDPHGVASGGAIVAPVSEYHYNQAVASIGPAAPYLLVYDAADDVNPENVSGTWLDRDTAAFLDPAGVTFSSTVDFQSHLGIAATEGGAIVVYDRGGPHLRIVSAGAPPGAACATSLDCDSRYCVSGLCCASACSGPCVSCAAATKLSGDGDGTCGPTPAGPDASMQCPVEGGCGHDGTCDGNGSCSLYPAGHACGPAVCDPSANAPLSQACDGAGVCQTAFGASCTPYPCVGGVCASTCTGDADCTPDAECVMGTCAARTISGTPCSDASSCASGFCADGYCCDQACKGQCESCGEPGSEGVCLPVAGAPRTPRLACPTATHGDPCTEAACDANTTTSCAAFVGSSVICRDAACKDGGASLAAGCDGKGACSPAIEASCGAYACAGTTCGASCKTDKDCTSGNRCSSGVCSAAATCDGHVLTSADGSTKTDCSPYGCSGGACRVSCDTVDDCAPPFTCDATHACGSAPTTPASAAGGCAVIGASPRPEEAWLALLAFAACALLLEKRRSRAPNR